MIESLLLIIVLSHAAVATLVTPPGQPCSTPNYFAVDIDDTFFTLEEHALSKNINAFNKARAPGNTLFFCTGRAYTPKATYITPLFAVQTGYNGCPGVYCNGALVLDKECKVLRKVAFEKSAIKAILRFVEENSYQSFAMFSDGQRNYRLGNELSFNSSALSRGRDYDAEKTTADEILSMDILKINLAIWIDLALIKDLSPDVDYIAKTSKNTTVLTPPGVTKAKGVVALSEHYQVNPEEVGFIGDGINDIELMELSKCSYAVGNALEEVKKHAKHILETTYDQAAFAEAMALVYQLSDD